MSAYVVGADGCKSGWITAVYKPENGRLTFTTHSDFASLLKSFSSDTTIAVDIPIGLTETFQPRICDRRARIVVGPRRSSVFPAPDRRLLQSSTYEEACALSRKISRKGITRQSFGIFNKIAQVDALMSPNLQSRVFEIHPEVCFWAAADRQQLYHPKRTALGFNERQSILNNVLPDIEIPTRREAARFLAGVSPDDVLDAIVAAWTAWRRVRGLSESIPEIPETDARGLRMEMVY